LTEIDTVHEEKMQRLEQEMTYKHKNELLDLKDEFNSAENQLKMINENKLKELINNHDIEINKIKTSYKNTVENLNLLKNDNKKLIEEYENVSG